MAAEVLEPPVRRAAAPAQTPAQTYVRVRGLVKRFGNYTALGGVGIEVAEGDTLALVGPSGCGKTTTLRCIAGLETPDAGSIEIGGVPVFDSTRHIDLMPEQRELGIVFQSYAVWPHMTVAENVGFPLKVRKVPKAEAAEHTDEILDLVGLRPWRDRSAMALSGGQQQRVALARALVHKPRLVLFDEPMSNLDAQLREQMRIELKLLQQRLNFTAIFVTHDQTEAFALARHVVVMNLGHIEAEGEPRGIFRRPATAFVARFFGYNVLPGKVETVAPSGSGAYAVDITVGDGLRLGGMHYGDVPPQPGAPAVLCVRKEQVGLAASGSAASTRDDLQKVPAMLRASSFQGLHDEHVVIAGGVELRAIQPALEFEEGPVTLTLAREDCLILPDEPSVADKKDIA
jgi:ABC-type Fe3+/spermidine/putrescine transport system ATPase subunit